MNFLRFVGRALLASYFIGHGASVLRDPEPHAADAQPVVDKVKALSDKVLPPSVRRFVPESTTAFVRLHGGLEVVGGALVATGFCRRIGALLLIASQSLRVAGGNPGHAKRPRVGPEFGRDIALLGAVVIEALDTQGRPGLYYRARLNRRQAALKLENARQAAQLKVAQAQRRVAEVLD